MSNTAGIQLEVLVGLEIKTSKEEKGRIVGYALTGGGYAKIFAKFRDGAVRCLTIPDGTEEKAWWKLV